VFRGHRNVVGPPDPRGIIREHFRACRPFTFGGDVASLVDRAACCTDQDVAGTAPWKKPMNEAVKDGEPDREKARDQHRRGHFRRASPSHHYGGAPYLRAVPCLG